MVSLRGKCRHGNGGEAVPQEACGHGQGDPWECPAGSAVALPGGRGCLIAPGTRVLSPAPLGAPHGLPSPSPCARSLFQALLSAQLEFLSELFLAPSGVPSLWVNPATPQKLYFIQNLGFLQHESREASLPAVSPRAWPGAHAHSGLWILLWFSPWHPRWPPPLRPTSVTLTCPAQPPLKSWVSTMPSFPRRVQAAGANIHSAFWSLPRLCTPTLGALRVRPHAFPAPSVLGL